MGIDFVNLAGELVDSEEKAGDMLRRLGGMVDPHATFDRFQKTFGMFLLGYVGVSDDFARGCISGDDYAAFMSSLFIMLVPYAGVFFGPDGIFWKTRQ